MNEDTEEKPKDVDSGWAWLSLCACFLGYGMLGFFNYTVGIFHIELLNYFDQGNAATSVVASAFTSTFCLVGPFAGIMINATDCRKTMIFGGFLMTLGFFLAFFAKTLNTVIVTFGFIAGIGSGFCVIPPLVAVGYSFVKYRGITTGVVVAGGGLGMFASGPVAQMFIDKYGLHGAYLMMASLSCHVILFGALLRPSGLEKSQKKERNLPQADSSRKCSRIRNNFDTSLFSNKSFILILMAVVLWHAAYAVIAIYVPSFAVVKGSTKMQASLLILEIGIGSTFSRVISGFTAGAEGGIDPVLLKLGVLGITGLLTLLFPFYSSAYWQQSLFAVLFGIYSGGLIAFTVPICMEIVGLSKLASAVGLVYLAGGIGYIIGPTLAGVLIDETGSYEYCFYYAGGCLTAGSFLVLLSTMWRPKDIDLEEKVLSQILFKGSTLASGSGFLSGSMHIAFQANQRTSSINSFGFQRESLKNSHNLIRIVSENIPLATSKINDE